MWEYKIIRRFVFKRPVCKVCNTEILRRRAGYYEHQALLKLKREERTHRPESGLARNRRLAIDGLHWCSSCKQGLPISQFYERSTGRLQSICKECICARDKQRRAKLMTKESSLARNKRLALEGLHWCSICKCAKPVADFSKRSNGNLRNECKTCNAEYIQKYKQIHPTPPEPRKEAGVCDRCGAPKESAKVHLCPACKAEAELHQKQRRQACKTRRQRERRATDGPFRMKRRVSEKLREILGKGKSGSASRWTGCSKQFLKDYLANLFTEDMSWDNYGQWHIDHIIPQAYFDFNDPDEVRMCWNYRNLQPLWGDENVAKGDILPADLDERLAVLRAVCVPSR